MDFASLKYNGLLIISQYVISDSTRCHQSYRETLFPSSSSHSRATVKKFMKSKWHLCLSRNQELLSSTVNPKMNWRVHCSLSSHSWRPNKISFTRSILIKCPLQSLTFATTSHGTGKMTMHSLTKISLKQSFARDLRKVLFSSIESNHKDHNPLSSYSSSCWKLTSKRLARLKEGIRTSSMRVSAISLMLCRFGAIWKIGEPQIF